MKIGILTQPLHCNYGGVMQAWALQQALRRMGHEPELIARWWTVPMSAPSAARRIGSFVKTLCLKGLRHRDDLLLRNPFPRNYSPVRPESCDRQFVKDHVAQTQRIYDDGKLRAVIDRRGYDAFLVGSDQVWREIYSPRIETYFLDFLSASDHRRRIAYGASFGTDSAYISEEKLPACRALLRRFDTVSVREDGGLRIAREVFGRKDAVRVLDPTLLLSADDYRRLIKPADLHGNGSYMAAYILDMDDGKREVASDLSARMCLPVNRMSASYSGRPMPTVSQWLANFAGAAFVVTDSFHGCVFSIIFHKPFVAIGNARRGLDRFTSMLGPLGLSGRLVMDADEYRLRRDTITPSTDYAAADRSLAAMRQTSLAFLREALA